MKIVDIVHLLASPDPVSYPATGERAVSGTPMVDTTYSEKCCFILQLKAAGDGSYMRKYPAVPFSSNSTRVIYQFHRI